jgi:hypothetical protein
MIFLQLHMRSSFFIEILEIPLLPLPTIQNLLQLLKFVELFLIYVFFAMTLESSWNIYLNNLFKTNIEW